MRTFLVLLLLSLTAGCCVMSRNISCETKVLTSNYYHYYTNGVTRTSGNYAYPVDPIYMRTSYVGGPWRGSDLYPATRLVLNILSGWSYSSAASGDYMANIFTLPTYPIYVVELPVQFCLDTILIPFDWWNTPKVPEGYRKVF